ncbi:MAG: hypothetical protein BGN91_06120 [Nitrobacter sp. 62-13]|uniref:hypothetical protein n=1 Tax=Nitrobacter sp. 62-13 TaxID=1895797 RepID=UPI00096807AB|nr:hypothetical protein [Nitrobacter sp. 62-13]OJU24284.1 MAG: hypothetical protein BGN91_06120 [Nitrobacter sp. 62-13]
MARVLKFIKDNKIAVFGFGFVLAVSVLIRFAMVGSEGRVVVASALNQSKIAMTQVSCLSIDPHKIRFNGAEYDTSKVMKLIDEVFSIQPTLLESEQVACPWVFAATIVKNANFGVKHNGRPAKYLVSVDVCASRPGKQVLDPNWCLSKNVYVFGSPLPVPTLFKLGLIGLGRLQSKQSNEWDVFDERVTP